MLDYLKATDEGQGQWLDDEFFFDEWLGTQQSATSNNLQR